MSALPPSPDISHSFCPLSPPPPPPDRQALGKVTADGVFLEALERNPGRYLPDVTEDKLSSEVVKVGRPGGGRGAGGGGAEGVPVWLGLQVGWVVGGGWWVAGRPACPCLCVSRACVPHCRVSTSLSQCRYAPRWT